MDSLKSRNMPTLVSIAGVLLLAGRTSAHGGHMEKIQEGEYMSADPIVRLSVIVGCDTMLTGDCRTRYYGFTSC